MYLVYQNIFSRKRHVFGCVTSFVDLYTLANYAECAVTPQDVDVQDSLEYPWQGVTHAFRAAKALAASSVILGQSFFLSSLAILS